MVGFVSVGLRGEYRVWSGKRQASIGKREAPLPLRGPTSDLRPPTSDLSHPNLKAKQRPDIPVQVDRLKFVVVTDDVQKFCRRFFTPAVSCAKCQQDRPHGEVGTNGYGLNVDRQGGQVRSPDFVSEGAIVLVVGEVSHEPLAEPEFGSDASIEHFGKFVHRVYGNLLVLRFLRVDGFTLYYDVTIDLIIPLCACVYSQWPQRKTEAPADRKWRLVLGWQV